jgi:SagB-type dehydrogenase family enzyme
MPLETLDDVLLNLHGDNAWELFHENSKMSHYERHPTFALRPSDATVVAAMKRLRTVKPYTDREKIPLPKTFPASRTSFDKVLLRRTTARQFGGGAVKLEELAKVLHMSYGVTRDNAGTHFPRPFRVVPSGGALYPLELYLYATRVNDLDPGLYHYDAEDRSLDVLRRQDDLDEIAGYFVQSDLARSAAAVLFVSAVFYRSTFKYGDRGYRFVLLEAGHLAQNAILTAQEMGLAAASVGGYTDRDVDRYLRFDGISESTIYVILLGESAVRGAPPGDLQGDW